MLRCPPIRMVWVLTAPKKESSAYRPAVSMGGAGTIRGMSSSVPGQRVTNPRASGTALCTTAWQRPIKGQPWKPPVALGTQCPCQRTQTGPWRG